jgi:serine/threonine-protein kinase
MGDVYLANDLRLGTQVVVKENRGGDPQLFYAEARILAALHHPNLPRVIDHWVEPLPPLSNGAQYLVMDYIAGQNLEDIVKTRGALTEQDALAWMRQILGAVKYLHANHIIHRDIKPQNIIITPDGRAVLVDFGIAKVMRLSGVTPPAIHGVGTPGFAPPEQYTSGTDERSDVYALGATLYFVLTGIEPPSVPERAYGKGLASICQRNTTVALRTEQVILQAMVLAGSQRYPSVAAVEQALLQPPTTTVSPQPPPALNPLPIVFGTLAIVLLLGALVVGILVSSGAITISRLDTPTLLPPATTRVESTRVVLAAPTTTAPTIVTSSPGAVQTQAVRDYQAAQTATAAAQTVAARSTGAVISAAQTLAAATIAAIRPATSSQLPTVAPPTLTPTPSPEKPRYRLDPMSAAGRADVTGISLFDTGTGSYQQIYGEPGISSAAFSRDGMRIVISSGIGDGRKHVLRTMDTFGKNAQDILQVVATKPGVGPGEAIWSPDGKQVAVYYATAMDFPGLFKMNVNNSVTTALKTDPTVAVANYRPRYWSVDDKWIVAYWLQDGQLYAFPVNGGEPKPISQMGNLEVYDERYWPWKRLIAPAKCKISDYFNCD